MVANLLKAGHEVVVYNRTRTKVDGLVGNSSLPRSRRPSATRISGSHLRPRTRVRWIVFDNSNWLATRTFLVLIAICLSSAPLFAQIPDQWMPSKKQMIDYLTEGFTVNSIIGDQITPVSTKATIFFLTKGSALVKCAETNTRRNGTITSRVISCSELTTPSPTP
jgi:hypothetical protein